MKKLSSVPVPSKRQCGDKCSIPISGQELFQIHDIADGLKIFRDIAQEAPELQLIQAEILITKTSRCACNLIHEVLNDQWQERHPDVDLIREC